MALKKNKKAQAYPLFALLFTVLVLGYVLVNFTDSKTIDDSAGDNVYIGTKQAGVFNSLQDEDDIQLFIDQAARLSAGESLDKITFSSCHLALDEDEELSDEPVSGCGNYIYPLWSTKEELCLPDCKLSFKHRFNKDFSKKVSSFFEASDADLNLMYDIKFDFLDNYFLIKGNSTEQVLLNIYEMNLIKQEIFNDASFKLYDGGIAYTDTDVLSKLDLLQPFFKEKIEKLIQDGEQTCNVDLIVSETLRSYERSDYLYGIGRSYCRTDDNLKAPFMTRGKENCKFVTKARAGQSYHNFGLAVDLYPVKDGNPDYNFGNDQDLMNKMKCVAGVGKENNIEWGGNFKSFKDYPHFQEPSTSLAKLREKYPNGWKSESAPAEEQVEAQEPKESEEPVVEEPIASSEFNKFNLEKNIGQYSFTPAFSVRVNKNLKDPLKDVKKWFEDTWNKCDDDLWDCLDTSMGEFNDKQDVDYEVFFASDCEGRLKGFFYDMMEAFEDCFSNGMYDCACEFNASNYYSSEDFSITFEPGKAYLSIIGEDSARKYVAEYSFTYGDFDWSTLPYPFYEYILDFDEQSGKLNNAKLIGFKEDSDGNIEEETTLFDNYPALQLTKLSNPTSNTLNQALFTNILDKDQITMCLYRKDRFRLCALPREDNQDDKNEELPKVSFAIQFKDKPPEGLCDENKIKVIPATKKPDSLVGSIASIKGFDLASIFSKIPIPVIQLLGTSLSVADIVGNLPGQQDANINIIVDMDNEDIAGYKIYCNDLPINLDTGFLNTNIPDGFVVVNNQINNKVSQLDTYVDNNPYSDFLRDKGCKVPVADITGKVSKVPGIKGIVEDDKLLFTLKKCGGNVFVDKLLEKDYCVTLVPVDKNGQEMSECAVTNCAKTNSLFNMVVKKFLESQLESIMIIPINIIPDNLQPYINLPDSDDFIDAALGNRDFDFTDIINLDKAQSDLNSAFFDLIGKQINNEVTGLAFVRSMDDLTLWGKQTVLNTLSDEIKQEDAKVLFDSLVEGRDVSSDAQHLAFQKGLNGVEDEKANEILNEFVNEGDPRSIAYREMKEAVNKEVQKKKQEKTNALKAAAEEKAGKAIKDTIIEKAVEKECINSYDVNIQVALDCLEDDEIDEIYNEIMQSDYSSAQRTLINKGLDEIEDDKKKEILQEVVVQRDFRGIAESLLIEEFNKMPDSKKKDFITDILQAKEAGVESVLQEVIIKKIPDVNINYITDLLKNGNVKDLIEDSLKSELKNHLNIFLTEQCTIANQD